MVGFGQQHPKIRGVATDVPSGMKVVAGLGATDVVTTSRSEVSLCRLDSRHTFKATSGAQRAHYGGHDP